MIVFMDTGTGIPPATHWDNVYGAWELDGDSPDVFWDASGKGLTAVQAVVATKQTGLIGDARGRTLTGGATNRYTAAAGTVFGQDEDWTFLVWMKVHNLTAAYYYQGGFGTAAWDGLSGFAFMADNGPTNLFLNVFDASGITYLSSINFTSNALFNNWVLHAVRYKASTDELHWQVRKSGGSWITRGPYVVTTTYARSTSDILHMMTMPTQNGTSVWDMPRYFRTYMTDADIDVHFNSGAGLRANTIAGQWGYRTIALAEASGHDWQESDIIWIDLLTQDVLRYRSVLEILGNTGWIHTYPLANASKVGTVELDGYIYGDPDASSSGYTNTSTGTLNTDYSMALTSGFSCMTKITGTGSVRMDGPALASGDDGKTTFCLVRELWCAPGTSETRIPFEIYVCCRDSTTRYNIGLYAQVSGGNYQLKVTHGGGTTSLGVNLGQTSGTANNFYIYVSPTRWAIYKDANAVTPVASGTSLLSDAAITGPIALIKGVSTTIITTDVINLRSMITGHMDLI